MIRAAKSALSLRASVGAKTSLRPYLLVLEHRRRRCVAGPDAAPAGAVMAVDVGAEPGKRRRARHDLGPLLDLEDARDDDPVRARLLHRALEARPIDLPVLRDERVARDRRMVTVKPRPRIARIIGRR